MQTADDEPQSQVVMCALTKFEAGLSSFQEVEQLVGDSNDQVLHL